jgi:type IV secretion system protein VirB9
MTRRMIVASSACVLASLLPVAAHADDRLHEHAYSANEVVRIAGRPGIQALIVFDPNEAIENVAIGSAQAWQVTPNKRADLLFVKPLETNARTNMTVVTNRHTYFFDLVASATAKPLYMLRFTYPKEQKPAAAGTAAGGTELAGLQRGEAGASERVDPAGLNFDWVRKGSKELQPARIYDDGKLTYLHWERGVPIPAILTVNDKGEEGPVNFAVRGDDIVIDSVPRQLVLRFGKERAELENRGPVRGVATLASSDRKRR